MAQLTAPEITVMFVALGVLLAAARLLGELAMRCHQPAVVGELLAGILLGPTALGRAWPELSAAIFPAEGNVAIVLSGMTTLAIALYLLVAGMEVELSLVWQQGRAAGTIAVAGFLFPFVLALAAAWVAPFALGSDQDADQRIFALFFATAMSISALPVIVRTLMDLGLYRTSLGMIVVAAAVLIDLAGWIVFAMTLGMLDAARQSAFSVPATIVLTLAFAFVMLTAGRWTLRRLVPWVQDRTTWPGGILAFALSLALLASAFSEWIGVHAIFGAFLVGVAIGDAPDLKQPTRDAVSNFVSFIFAPLFFASIGLHVDFIAGFHLELVLAVLAIACIGKLVGCGLAARFSGLDWRSSWAIGAALNARGAMEIILGLLALESGLIRQRMFVALVVVAVVTSMMSGPLMKRLLSLDSRSRPS